MRFAFAHSLLIGALIVSCGGRAASDDDGGVASDGGDDSGEQPTSGTGAAPGDGAAASGGGANGGTSSGGAPSGGSSMGGTSTGGLFSGGATQGGAAGAPSGGGSGGEAILSVNVGHVQRSCGGNMWSRDGETFLDCTVGGEHEFHPDCVIVDCAAYGDVDSFCVFSNHCYCSDGFACEDDESLAGSECNSRFSCVPVE